MQGKITLLFIQQKYVLSYGRTHIYYILYIIYYNFIIITISFLFSFQQGRFAFENSIFRNGTAHHIFHSGNLIHHFCHDLFNNRTESAGARIPFDSFLRNGTNCFLLKNKLHIVHAEKFLVLADKSVFGSDRILISASSFSGWRATMTGSLPINSGISPNFRRSSGSTF